MDIELTALIAAFGGGLFAAAIGALPAFIMTGFAVIAGVALASAGGRDVLLSGFAFGPFLGPHISFAGGVAAAAYAGRRGLIDNGRDIATSLMGLNRPDVLVVGGLFGAGGYLCERGFAAWGLGPWTDTIALTVAVSAVVARLAFGRTGLFGLADDPGLRFRPTDKANWVQWQETPGQLVAIGFGVGAVSAYTALLLGAGTGGEALGFGVAAASLLFLQFGGQLPVTHHIALPAALAALVASNLWVGILFGMIGAFLGEFYSRMLLIHGDTHIDPPAAAIATAVLLLRVAAAAGLA